MNKRTRVVFVLVLFVAVIVAFAWYNQRQETVVDPTRIKPVAVIDRVSGLPLTRPMAVAAGKGLLAIADEGRVLVVKEETREVLFQFNQYAGILYPVSLVFDDKNNLWVADLYANSVKVFDSTGLLLHEVRGDQLKVKEFAPTALAITGKGLVAVADNANHRIWFIDNKGKATKRVKTNGAYLNGLVWDKQQQRLLATDSPKQKVIAVNEEGKISVVMDKGFEHPRGLAWSSDASLLYVADTHQHRLDVRDKSGVSVRTMGKQGSGVGDFLLPMGIGVSPAGLIYVADKENHRIVVYSE